MSRHVQVNELVHVAATIKQYFRFVEQRMQKGILYNDRKDL
jgi:hypothetical protein